MTEQEKAKKLLPIIQAIAEGNKIQFSFNHRDWIDADKNNSDLKNICASIIVGGADYRIKPEEISISFLPNESCYKCGKKLTIENMASIMLTSNPPKYMCKECAGEKPKLKTEKHYRPFKDCDELIEYYHEKYKTAVGCDIVFPSLYKPNIWVKRYEHTRDVLMNRTFLITGYEDSGVVVDNKWIGMDDLFEKFKFLDGSSCGVLEKQ